MKEKFINYYMKMAELTAELSYAKRLQVGAVIVKNQQVIGTGYNGTPAGWDNNCEDVEWCAGGGWLSPEEIEEGWPYEGTYLDSDDNEMRGRYRLKTKPEVLHAERNALDKLAKRGGVGGTGASMFVTHAPCLECAKSIYGAGITEVFYGEDYRSEDGIYFLKMCGVNIVKMSKGDK
jgi:dCMP deaminase